MLPGTRTQPWRGLFVAGVIAQVFLIGLGLFVAAENKELHRDFGWILHLAPLLVLVAAALAGAGRKRILQSIALAITVWIVPILAAVRADAPLAAAFHPVGALLAFWLAVLVARGATSLVGTSDAETRTTRREWLLVAVVVVILLGLSMGGPEA